MDPTDPVWMQSGMPPHADSGPPSTQDNSSRDEQVDSPAAGFTDFAQTEPVDARDAEATRVSSRQRLKLILLPFGFTFLLTSLFLAMRGVLDLGGMVALGGPYEIAHPAPGYWWIFPVAIIGCILIVFASAGMFSFGHGMAGPASPAGLPLRGMGMLPGAGGTTSLVALFFWPAIFLSLGWNFCEYGFFRSGGRAWGWVISGVVFMLMGGLPLYFSMRKVSGRELLEAVRINAGVLWPQLLGIAAGIPLGILFFRAVS
jgi:hypothetical protein